MFTGCLGRVGRDLEEAQEIWAKCTWEPSRLYLCLGTSLGVWPHFKSCMPDCLWIKNIKATFSVSYSDLAIQSEAKSEAFCHLPLEVGCWLGYTGVTSETEKNLQLSQINERLVICFFFFPPLEKKIVTCVWFITLSKTETVRKSIQKCFCKDAERKVIAKEEKAEISVVQTSNYKTWSQQRALKICKNFLFKELSQHGPCSCHFCIPNTPSMACQ